MSAQTPQNTLAATTTPASRENRSGAFPRRSNRQPRTPAARRISCSGCDRRWTAPGAAHCSGCHRHFTSVATFNRHRVNYVCMDPATVINAKTGNPFMQLTDDDSWQSWIDPALPTTWWTTRAKPTLEETP